MDVKTAEPYTYELESLPRIGGTSTNPTTAAPSRVASTDALDSEQQREEDAIALPPVDGGIQAWWFVFCAFILEALVWGFPFSYVATIILLLKDCSLRLIATVYSKSGISPLPIRPSGVRASQLSTLLEPLP